ncbi:hypothetical protein C8R43DRAFT_943447 [Mycena crocata]|nr:hypothetical protein C8R43DRAFT_943447 [Mycena crocata]
MSQGGHIPDRACDNTECNGIHDKTDLWRCSGCLDVYYCSPECQKSDWRAGGHREICSESGTLRLSMQNTPSVRERDFLRYYIDAEYHFSKATIYLEQALCLQRFPNSAYFTLFDYTWNGRADISVHALESDSPPVLDLYAYGAEWQDSIARARRSGGRMELHVVRMQQGRSAPRYVLIPLHRDRTDVVVLLKELSAELPTALDDPRLLEVWAKFQPRLDAADKDIRETH